MSIYGNNADYRIKLLNEAYFGKSDILLEMEKQIGIIRENAARKYTDINRSKEVQELNRLFEKQFGMEIFSLHVEQNNTINAYTIPVATRFDIAKYEVLSRRVIATKEGGFRFDKDNNLCIICNVYLGLLNHPELTNGEILAIILHELGHNFADAISQTIDVANKEFTKGYLNFLIYSILIDILMSIPSIGASLIYIPFILKKYYDNLNSTNRKKEKKTKNRKIHGLLKGIAASCNDCLDYANSVINLLLINPKSYKKYVDSISKNDIKKNKESANRQNEVIADKFAVVYGYGPELSSALLKMDLHITKSEEYVSKKFKDKMNEINEVTAEFYKFDCHPHTIQRLNECIKTLESELEKSDLDPKLIKAMKQQINELKKLRDKATTITNNMTDKQRITAKTNAKVLLEDPDALDKILEDQITKAFDDMIE